LDEEQRRTHSYFCKRRTFTVTTAIILTLYPNPFRDSLRSSQNLYTVSSPYEERDIWRLRLRKILEGSGNPTESSGTPEQTKADEDAFDDVVTLCQNPSER